MSNNSKGREHDETVGFLKFNGPSVNEGKMNVDSAGKALIALGKMFDNYTKSERGNEGKKLVELRIFRINKSSTEFGMCAQEVAPILQPLANAGTMLIAAQALGLTELTKSFFSTVGEQLALKIFLKGKEPTKIAKTLNKKKQSIETVVTNLEGAKKIVSDKAFEQYKQNGAHIKDLVQLDKGKAEELQIGYEKGEAKTIVAKINYQDKPNFQGDFDHLPARERFDEDFNESNASRVKIVGQFMDYYGLAQKYHFSFQARKKQGEIGKQYILCIVPEQEIANIIDYLKPGNKKDLCIYGKAQKNAEGKYDKMKIEYISQQEDFNPDQVELFTY
jgi:hypothetical protein